MKGAGKIIQAFFIMAILSISFSNAAEARAESALDPRMEKAFLEGSYDKIITDSTCLIDAKSSGRDELYYARGLANIKLSRFDRARSDFNTVLLKYPRSDRRFDAYMSIGDSYLLEGRNDEAARSYEELLRNCAKDKNMASVYYKLGRSYMNSSSGEKADEYFAKAKREAPLSFESRMTPAAGYAKPSKVPMTAQGGRFMVQVGSFKNKDNADKLSRRLASEGYPGHVEYAELAGGGIYRVKVGGYNSRDEAEDMAAALRRSGYSTSVCSADAN